MKISFFWKFFSFRRYLSVTAFEHESITDFSKAMWLQQKIMFVLFTFSFFLGGIWHIYDSKLSLFWCSPGIIIFSIILTLSELYIKLFPHPCQIHITVLEEISHCEGCYEYLFFTDLSWSFLFHPCILFFHKPLYVSHNTHSYHVSPSLPVANLRLTPLKAVPK